MPIDPDAAIGATVSTQDFAWSNADVLLYHLALGAGGEPTSARELRYTTEDDLRVLPTFPVVAPDFHRTEPPVVSWPGVDIDLSAILHGGQEITVHRPIPTAGKAHQHTRIVDVQDKGKAAVIVQQSEITTTTGDPLCTTRSQVFVRGEGGFGGRRGPSNRSSSPEQPPDLLAETPTLPQQALLYRLCGDRNPLHSDPEFAAAAGFAQPILHGLCTYGMVCKELVDRALDGDTTRVRSYGARFAGVVYPGETLRTRIWRTDEGLQAATTAVERGEAPVLSDIVMATTAE